MAVLVVEDEVLILMLAQSILREAGYETLTATDEAEANAILRSGVRVDVLFTDIELKKSRDGGLALAQQAVRDTEDPGSLYDWACHHRCCSGRLCA